MLKRFGIVLLLFVLAGCGDRKPVLNLFIWSEYIDPEVIRQFEKRFQCRVQVDVYEDEESMLAKVQTGGAGLYDLVVPSNHLLPVMVALELLSPLRHKNIPNLRHLDQKFMDPPFDSQNQYSLPYQWGTVGVYYRKPAETVAPPQSWGYLFDPEQQPGQFVLIDSMRDLMGAALQYQGNSLNSTNKEDIIQARDLLLQTKANTLSFDGSVAGKNKVLSGLAQAAIVYSGEAARGMQNDPDTGYFIPIEGSQIWVDNLAILAEAPRRDLAEQFINFLLDPPIAAQNAAYTQFATANKAAREFIPAKQLENPAIYPDSDAVNRLEYLMDLGGFNRLYDEAWTQIKSK